MNQHILLTIGKIVTTAITVVIVVAMALSRVDTYLIQKAVDDCGRVSRYIFQKDSKTKTESPMFEAYVQCLKDKGVKK